MIRCLPIVALTAVMLLSVGCHDQRYTRRDQRGHGYYYNRSQNAPPGHYGRRPHAQAYLQHEYLYYPTSQVYHDHQRNLYFYQEQGRWQSARQLPRGMHLESREGVRIDMDDERPYTRFEEHRAQHPSGRMAPGRERGNRR